MSRLPPRALLERYGAFYEEVVRIKHESTLGRLAVYLGLATESGSVSAPDLAEMVSARLEGLLRTQAKEVRARGTDAEYRAYRMAQYVMAAQVDELFLLDWRWSGQEEWLEHTLEQRLFGTLTAGRDLFVHLDRLLERSTGGTLQEELASVFLVALRLGFKGRFRSRDGERRELPRRRARLVHRFGGAEDRVRSMPVFQQAYRHVVAGDREVRLASFWAWFWRRCAPAAVLYVALAVAISELVWRGPVVEINRELEAAMEAIRSQPVAANESRETPARSEAPGVTGAAVASRVAPALRLAVELDAPGARRWRAMRVPPEGSLSAERHASPLEFAALLDELLALSAARLCARPRSIVPAAHPLCTELAQARVR